MKNNILLKGLDISYSKEAGDFKKRMLGNAGTIYLKDLNIHLYSGEVLGLLSEKETLFYIKEVLTGTLNPSKGKITRYTSVLSLDVDDHTHNHFELGMFIEEMLEEYLGGKEYTVVIDKLLSKAIIRNNLKKAVKDLSRKQLAHILLEISSHVNVNVIIYNDFYQDLDDPEKFQSVVNEHEKNGRGVLLLESSIEAIEKMANYFTWVSYGQIRFEGSVERGVEIYSKYLKDKSKIKNVDEEALFDLEWKRRIFEDGDFSDQYKRLGRKQASILDNVNIQKIIVTMVLVFIMLVAILVIFMNITFINEEPTFTEENQFEDVSDSERLAYAFSDRDGLTIGGEELPPYTLVEVVSSTEDTYTLQNKDQKETVGRDEVIYFNPASLYTEGDFMDLLQYTDPVIQNNYLFYSNYLNGDREFLEQNITFDSLDEYQGKVAGIPITYHFRGNTVFSMEFDGIENNSIVEDKKLSSDVTIFRVDGGFMIYDSQANKWNYMMR